MSEISPQFPLFVSTSLARGSQDRTICATLMKSELNQMPLTEEVAAEVIGKRKKDKTGWKNGRIPW